MRETLTTTAAATVAGVIALATLQWWLNLTPTSPPKRRVPDVGDERRKLAARKSAGQAVKAGGSFEFFDAHVPPIPGLWPRFRGAAGDNIAADSVALASSWPPGGPPVLWALDLGEGHAGPAGRWLGSWFACTPTGILCGAAAKAGGSGSVRS